MKPARDRILAAASRIHRSGGVAAVSLRAVAGAIGVTPMAIYRHFKDKDDLLDALAAAGFDKLEGYFASAVRARSPLKAVERALMAYADFALAEPNAFELMFLIPRRTVPEAPASLRTSPSPSFEVLISAVREAIEADIIAGDDPEQVILLCWATVHGLLTLRLTGRFGDDEAHFRRVYAGAVKHLLSMLTA